MSEAIFPTLPGLAWDVSKSPEFCTITKKSPSGLDVSAVLSAFPCWHFSLQYEFLRDNGLCHGELQQLVGFFLQRYGNVDNFLYFDPNDHYTANQVIGTGDGVTTKFQLYRSFGGFIEPVFGIKGPPLIFLNKEQTTACSVSTNAAVSFTTPPIEGAVISWTGQFYFRVKFDEPMTEFNNFMYKLWEAKKIEFTSVKRVIG